MNEENRKVKLVSMIDKSQKGLDQVMPTFRELYKAYKAFLDPEVVRFLDDTGKSRIPYFLIMNKLQKIHASFIEAYFTNKQFAKINEKPSLKGQYFDPILQRMIPFSRGNYDGLSIAAINALQNAVDYYTTEDDNSILYHSLVKAFTALEIYGTGVIKANWSNGLKIEYIQLKDIKFDVEAENMEKLQYCVHDIYLTKKEILELRDSGVFLPDADYSKIRHDDSSQNSNSPDEFKRFRLQEVYELEKGKWYVTTMFNKQIVLRDKVSLLYGLPFVVGRVKEQESSPDGTEDSLTVKMYGDSISAPLIPIQREMTILRNQQVDSATATPRYISNDKAMNPFDFMNKKMPIVQGDPNKVKEIPSTNMRDSVYNVDKLEVEAQDIIGVVDYGANNGKQMNKTATGMSILTSESSKILQLLLRGCNETLIKPLFRKITELVWAYGSAEFFYGVDRTQKLDYQVGVDVGLGATNKESQLNSKMVAYSKMIESAQMHQDPMIIQEKLQKAEQFLYKELFPLMGIENFEEYYNNDDNRSNESIQGDSIMGQDFGQVGGATTAINGPI